MRADTGAYGHDSLSVCLQTENSSMRRSEKSVSFVTITKLFCFAYCQICVSLGLAPKTATGVTGKEGVNWILILDVQVFIQKLGQRGFEE